MAKLSHLQTLIRRIAQVDEGRARVLVMKARAAGHFTTGGRGVNAPDVGLSDATSALLLSLQMEQPTDAGEAVSAMKKLPFFIVKHDPGDGVFRDLDEDFIDPDGKPLLDIMPTPFAGEVPATLGRALDLAFASTESFSNRFDRIEHRKTSQGSTVTLSMDEKDYRETNSSWAEGFKAWRFVFETETLALYDDLGCWINKTVHGEALRALRDLIRGAD